MKPSLIKKHNISVQGNENSDQTIVFAHGFGTDQTAWKDVWPAFAEDYRMILFDNIGAGLSDMAEFSPMKYNNVSTYADDLIAIAQAYHLKGAIVVAHSVSSMISLLASIKAPHLFSKMVFVCASPRYLNDSDYKGGFTKEELLAMFGLMQSNYYAWVSGFSAAAMGNADQPELGAMFAYTLGKLRPDIALSVAKVIFESDIRDLLPKFNKEVLLLQTMRDIAVPAEVAEYLHHHIEGSKLMFLEAEGHFPHISAPQMVVNAIKTYIS